MVENATNNYPDITGTGTAGKTYREHCNNFVPLYLYYLIDTSMPPPLTTLPQETTVPASDPISTPSVSTATSPLPNTNPPPGIYVY